MIINKPWIEIRGENTFLVSIIKDEVNNTENEIFFSVPNKYGKYLVDEIADAFVVAMLLPALISGQNIKINAPISEVLNYHLDNSIIYLLSKVFKKSLIKLIPERTINIDFNATAIVTGFSGGIDSFSTVLQHISPNCPANLRITHLSLFNIGSYGNNFDKSQRCFMSDLKRAENFANQINLPLVSLNSNISSAYNALEIYHFSSRSSMCLGAGILALQKLFKRYFISSSGILNDIKFVKQDQYFYEPLLFPLLSCNTQITISNANMDRVEKTKYLMNNDLVKQHLYVCASDIYNEKSGTNFKKDTKPNCSECIKCTRTLLTLDILGVLDQYSDRFDLDKYRKKRDEIIMETIVLKNHDHFSQEIYHLMIEKKFPIKKGIRRKAYWKTISIKLKTKAYTNKLVRRIYFSILKKQ